MAFGITRLLKGLIIREEQSNTPKEIEIIPGGTSSTKTTITSSQTTNKTITLPDASTTLVGTDATQTLTNKTIQSSTVDSTPIGQTTPAAISTTSLVATTADINAGTIDATVIGATTPAAGTFTTITASSADIGGATLVTVSSAQTLTNKSLVDNSTEIVDNSDASKKILFDAAGTTGTSTTLLSSQSANRIITIPDATDTLVGKATTDTLTNKTLTSPVIDTGDINSPDIDGGTIDSTVIGATTPAAATVTALTTTGDAIIGGNLTVNGTTTTLNTQTLDVEDKNITVSLGGNDAASEGAGLTVDRTGTDGSLIYKDASATKWAIGSIGSEVDVVGISSTQTLTNKTLQFLQQSVTSDAATTGATATLAAVTTGIVRLTNASLTSVSGIPAGLSGQSLTVENKTGAVVSFLNEDASATAANRIQTGTAATVTIQDNATLLFTYDSTSSRWMLTGGSGSSSGTGGTEYVTNGNGETGTTGWVTYNDGATSRPVDGTGGTATGITFATTSTNPLRGTSSLLFTKDAANRQGTGASYDFTIDRADQAKVLTITQDYIVNSGTFVAGTPTTDSDVIAYIYDITNAKLIEPSNIKMLSNSSTTSDRYQAEFQTASNSTSYRLIIHVASTSASAYAIKFEASVKPNEYVYGSPIAGPFTYTPALISVGTPSGVAVTWWRDGSYLIAQGSFNTGTTTAALFQLPLPSGLVIDSTVYGQRGIVGNLVRNGGSPALPLIAIGGRNYLGLGAGADASNQWTEVNGSAVLGNGENETFNFRVAISGWQTSVQMSDQGSTRVVAAKYTLSAGGSQTAGTAINFNTKAIDTHGAVSSGRFTAPVPGIYRVTASNINISSSVNIEVDLYKNGVNQNILGSSPTTAAYWSGSTLIELVTGDIIDLRLNGTQTLSANAGFNVERVTGPSAIAATETIAALYTGAPPTGTLNSSFNTATFGTRVKDSHSSYSSGTYTISTSGQYDISAAVRIAGTYVLNNTAIVAIFVDGVIAYQNVQVAGGAVSELSSSVNVKSIPLLAGQLITIRTATTATGPTFVSSAPSNLFSIARSGNY